MKNKIYCKGCKYLQKHLLKGNSDWLKCMHEKNLKVFLLRRKS